MTNPDDILEFWRSIGPLGWWKSDDKVDNEIINRFSGAHSAAASGKLGHWQENPDDCLALVIILDQFSRNMFRGDPRTFAQDPLALSITSGAVSRGFDKAADPALHSFYYLPFMHSEAVSNQEKSVRLMHRLGEPNSLKAALEHREIILRFARFPHRNGVLGRHTTPAEQKYLDGGGFKG